MVGSQFWDNSSSSRSQIGSQRVYFVNIKNSKSDTTQGHRPAIRTLISTHTVSFNIFLFHYDICSQKNLNELTYSLYSGKIVTMHWMKAQIPYFLSIWWLVLEVPADGFKILKTVSEIFSVQIRSWKLNSAEKIIEIWVGHFLNILFLCLYTASCPR